MIWALVAAGVAFGSTMVGGLAALRWARHVESLMALAGGVVLAAVFFDLLPNAVRQAAALRMSTSIPLGVVVIGYLTFHAVENFVHHRHREDESSVAGMLGALGFIVHSFFDGLAIGLGFRISPGLGVLVAAAVIGHDFSDGLNTVSYLVAHHQTAGRSIWFLLADALSPLVGAILASVIPIPASVFPVALGFFSGLFIYAAATNLLPRTRDLPMSRSLSITGTGAILMFLVTRLA